MFLKIQELQERMERCQWLMKMKGFHDTFNVPSRPEVELGKVQKEIRMTWRSSHAKLKMSWQKCICSKRIDSAQITAISAHLL